MKRLLASILATVALAGSLVALSAPAQAVPSTSQVLAIGACQTHLSFGAFDSRIRWSVANGYWMTGRYRSGYGTCNGVYILHQGHMGIGTGDGWAGSYRIRTFTNDGAINYTGPWRSRPAGAPYYNIRPEISNGRLFEIHERATACLLSDCANDHWPVFAMTF